MSAGVMCVDDNDLVAEAVELQLGLSADFRWLGRLHDAGRLVEEARRRHPDIVLLDIDMPGPDPFEALAQLASEQPDTRVVMFSGHLRSDLIDRAVEAGAWGYVSKSEGPEAMLAVLHKVAAGEFSLAPDVAAEYVRRQ